ncbi:uncharacterized protein LOC112494466 [Cephus cinctus]|uniref:Uncharacterized protein LOC112494466 n=1 Tax=Cephus cinctus TaxID=211228 RepID=A0AAJ7RJ87_CEPCN|nr:uncharacterized protein LOC112494466 [Cephus cinctus]
MWDLSTKEPGAPSHFVPELYWISLGTVQIIISENTIKFLVTSMFMRKKVLLDVIGHSMVDLTKNQKLARSPHSEIRKPRGLYEFPGRIFSHGSHLTDHIFYLMDFHCSTRRWTLRKRHHTALLLQEAII